MDLLAHLETYVTVADEGSFSRAADRLRIAQPLLSRRIKTLEAHLGGRLFDRPKRQISTTDFGLLLLPYAEDVLNRAQQLRQIARSARASTVRAVGVPADCDPAALGRLVRAAADRGAALAVVELSPAARVAGLADGSLAYALTSAPPENAALRVRLGLAAAPVEGEREPSQRRAVHLDELRPRRRRPATEARHTQPPILTTVEDQVPYAVDRWGRAAARAGLPKESVRPVASTATALAETLAGQALLLCPERFARRNGAAWAPLADNSLHRGYDVSTSRDRHASSDPPGWLVALLGSAVGAAAGSPTVSADIERHVRARLAARG